MIEVGKARERRLGAGRERRLRVRSKQVVATLPKPLECVRSFQPVEIADAPAPIREVDVVLGAAVSQ